MASFTQKSLRCTKAAVAGAAAAAARYTLSVFSSIFFSFFKTPDLGEGKHNGGQIEQIRSAGLASSKCKRQYPAAAGDNNFKWQSLHY